MRKREREMKAFELIHGKQISDGQTWFYGMAGPHIPVRIDQRTNVDQAAEADVGPLDNWSLRLH